MTAIVCVSRSWGIGRDGALLFRISADHKRFRTLTVGKTVILGHKTLDTFPGGKPLKDRRNIVLSHRDLDVPGAEIAHSFDEAAALGGDDAIVIDVGGTTTDLGVLQAGFPRESGVAVTIGGVPRLRHQGRLRPGRRQLLPQPRRQSRLAHRVGERDL